MRNGSVSLLLILSAIISNGQPTERVRIAAASDLKFALDSIVSVFAKTHVDARIDVTYGSSGKLSEQISHGAPFDLFFSADIDYPMNLKSKGMTSGDVQTYGVGRIVIWSRQIDPNIQKIKSLVDKTVSKIAIANPMHAPYGKRAEEALRYYDIYDDVSSRLVYGENISQTAQFVTTGAADVGIVALSLALSPTMKKMHGHYWVIPELAHKPLKQGFVLLKRAERNPFATAFKDFVQTKHVSDILSYFGFGKN